MAITVLPSEVESFLGGFFPSIQSEMGNTNLPRNLTPSLVRQVFQEQGYTYPRKNIIFHCLKGGAAKTTLAYNVSFRLAQLGCRILLVDLDKQANATYSFTTEKPKHVFVDVVLNKCKVSEAITAVDSGLHLLPSSLDNARLEMELLGRRENPRLFYRNLFAPVRDNYDLVIFDLPPDLSHNTYLSSLFADIVCVPTTPDEYSVYGMKLTLSSLEDLKKEYPDLNLEVLVVWTKYDGREKSASRYISDLQDLGSAQVMPFIIRSDITFKHAQAQGKSVFDFKRKSNAKEDIDILARELIGLNDLNKAGTT
ncbi:MAG: ParA family protein [Proteobacteria bacterium]|nr:ParA family protein [Pseudomonadota bacterium]NDG28077.1 ParA family protein [Pseudomonadota bacterium]